MHKAKKNRAEITGYSSKSAFSSIGQDIKSEEDAIEYMTDYFCDHITESLEAVEKTIESRIISRILKKTGGNQTKAAKLLGINRTTLGYKIKKLKIRVH